MNRYRVNGSGGWNDTAYWSLTSGGSSGASVPTQTEDVVIDENSGFSGGGTITMDGDSAKCRNFTSISGHNYTIVYDTCDIEIYGSAVFEAGTNFDNQSEAYTQFYGTGNHTIELNGAHIFWFAIYGSGTFTLQDDLVVENGFVQENGIFDANDFNVTALYFSFYGTHNG